MKIQRVLIGLLAGALIFGPLALWIGGVRAVAFENRPLTATPDLTQGWSALDSVPGWATDHLPGRQRAVTANAWVDFHLLGSMPRASRPVPVPGAAPGPAPLPMVVRGKDGYLFLGEDFGAACAPQAAFRRGLAALARLAEVVERSGRRVMFTVAPNKTSVTSDFLPSAAPYAHCSTSGMKAQERMLDALDDNPLAFNVRRPLVEEHLAGRATYWKTDTHWNPAGAGVYLKELVSQFAPELDERLRVTSTSVTEVGDLVKLIGLSDRETSRSVKMTGVGTPQHLPPRFRSTTAPGEYASLRWRSKPAKGLITGRTVMIGDSFTNISMPVLQPAVADGEFLWLGRVTPADMAARIAASDTVIFEVVQRVVTNTPLAAPAFRRMVEKELRAADRKAAPEHAR